MQPRAGLGPKLLPPAARTTSADPRRASGKQASARADLFVLPTHFVVAELIADQAKPESEVRLSLVVVQVMPKWAASGLQVSFKRADCTLEPARLLEGLC
jgi:hypothetical protein